MDKSQAIDAITSVFRRYRRLTPTDQWLLSALDQGKLYELYVLSELLIDLRRRGFLLRFCGQTLKFKQAPGKIKVADPHFLLTAPDRTRLWLFVDIEFLTLGTIMSNTTDLSDRHELDIVLVDETPDYPSPCNILLAVECKSAANFRKSIVKEALGIRRELSLLEPKVQSKLTRLGGRRPVSVPADPASEFWLAYVDGVGTCYSRSPGFFGIEFKHLPAPSTILGNC